MSWKCKTVSHFAKQPAVCRQLTTKLKFDLCFFVESMHCEHLYFCAGASVSLCSYTTKPLVDGRVSVELCCACSPLSVFSVHYKQWSSCWHEADHIRNGAKSCWTAVTFTKMTATQKQRRRWTRSVRAFTFLGRFMSGYSKSSFKLLTTPWSWVRLV